MGHPVLRAKALPLKPEAITEPVVQALIDDMFETMQEYSGIGLAAPQIHERLRVLVAGVRDAPVGETLTGDGEMPRLALVNPEVTPLGPDTETGWEGCLSIPDIRGLVPRAAEVRVRAYDRHGQPVEFTASGLPARVIQHETDHLDGVLFFDRMKSFDSLAYMEEYQRFWATSDDDAEDDEE